MTDLHNLEYLFCCQYTTNNKILDLLEDLATNRKKCNITNKLRLYGDDYHKLYIDVLKFFKVKDSQDLTPNKTMKTWSSIRKKAVKDLILKNFIIEVKYKYNFDEATTNNLKRDLMIGLNFKNVNDKNIVLKDNKIETIIGLNLTTNEYNWDYNVFNYGR